MKGNSSKLTCKLAIAPWYAVTPTSSKRNAPRKKAPAVLYGSKLEPEARVSPAAVAAAVAAAVKVAGLMDKAGQATCNTQSVVQHWSAESCALTVVDLGGRS